MRFSLSYIMFILVCIILIGGGELLMYTIFVCKFIMHLLEDRNGKFTEWKINRTGFFRLFLGNMYVAVSNRTCLFRFISLEKMYVVVRQLINIQDKNNNWPVSLNFCWQMHLGVKWRKFLFQWATFMFYMA